jgi:hypothetical protein
MLSGPLGLDKTGFSDLYGQEIVTEGQRMGALVGTVATFATAGGGSSIKPTVTGVVKNGIGLSKTSGWIKRSVFESLDAAIQKKMVAAIDKGIVAPVGKQGIIKLTATEASSTGYTHKLKILGSGGDLRIYGTQGQNGHIFFDRLMGH